jgi:hypothetical protein
MLLQVFTYHQVMPAFIQFLLSFGVQLYRRDFHFAGFKGLSHIDSPLTGAIIPEIGRSGYQIQMCYNLKSVEQSSDGWTWQIRQGSLYHNYDLKKDRSTWVIVKANSVLRKAIHDALCHQYSEYSRRQSRPTGLDTAALTHEVIIAWAGDKWQLYINDLEHRFQGDTRTALHVRSEHHDGKPAHVEPKKMAKDRDLARRSTWKSRSFSLHGIGKHLRRTTTDSAWQSEGATLYEGKKEDQVASLAGVLPIHVEPPRRFSLSNLQSAQRLEDEANEALLVLGSNISVLHEIGREYRAVESQASEQHPLIGRNRQCLQRLQRCINDVVRTLVMQRSRLECLLRLIADRKALVSSSGSSIDCVELTRTSCKTYSNTKACKRLRSLRRKPKYRRRTWNG